MDSRTINNLIERWKSWNQPKLASYRPREVNQIATTLQQGRNILLKGVRGSGKSTTLRLAASRLVEMGVPSGNIVYFDLDDPGLSPKPTLETLDFLLRATDVFQKGRQTYLFLDEVGKIGGWSDWATTLTLQTAVSIAASQSASATSTNLSACDQFSIMPFMTLGLDEVIAASTDMKVDKSSAQKTLDRYLTFGGFPFALSAKSDRESLASLFFRVLFSDILVLREIRDVDKLTDMAFYLISNPAKQVSATRMKGRFTRSIDQARAFLSHIENAGLIHLVGRIEDRGRQAQAARRCFPVDVCFSTALSTDRIEHHHLAETAVFHSLLKHGLSIHLWRYMNEHGFLVEMQKGQRSVVFVAPDSTHNSAINTAKAGMRMTGSNQAIVLSTKPESEDINTPSGTIAIRSISSWLIQPKVFYSPDDISVDNSESKTGLGVSNPTIPSHLL